MTEAARTGPPTGPAGARAAAPPPAVFGWRSGPVVVVAVISLAIGFGQFGAIAALGDVAKSFGHPTGGTTFAEQAGLSGALLGVGLAVLRLASLGGLVLAGSADRFGRRATLVTYCVIGLSCTVLAATSPSYWWFVAIFALGRPFLSAAAGIAQVSVAELTASAGRARAVALVTAGYGVGAGLTALVHSAGHGALGFRGVFALATVPLVLVVVLARRVVEPPRFAGEVPAERGRPVIGPVGRPFRWRLVTVALLTFAVSAITGPANSYVYIYAQNVRHESGAVTSAMIVAAGVTGLIGLLVGRWLADHWGRRPTLAVALVAIAGFGIVAYSGSTPGLVVGYVLGVLAGGVIAPAAGALVNELFPTSVRASVTGWTIAAGVLGAVGGLLVFGAVADASAGNGAGPASLITFLPMLVALALLVTLPETKGTEPEQLWPEPTVEGPAAP
ncbi:MAG TPA: MFS transporter [Acidimicrobiales bacterium]|nr:MFS transporter [Acidimicrobiales bacterium]